MERIVCSICQDDLKLPVANPNCCSHLFCYGCLNGWLEKNRKCPIDNSQIQTVRVMASENGPVLQTIPIPEADSPLEGELFDITKCFPDIFLLPKKQWVESLGDAQEDLHNMFSQILDFEGTIQSYIDMNPENILKLKKIEDLLLRFRMYINNLGKDIRFYESLDEEEKQSLERLVNRHENYVIHYFTSSFEKVFIAE
ncbi:unnamed protein product [Hymenolepis diminuta]|uniref:RING-type domain-containing protein n=1 Tax=Hymenolepis diminuta TaxID=6216 RepID=A0A0R3SA57_HYMDI|nr:unnamed protein product [Hymenolepis diminuta]